MEKQSALTEWAKWFKPNRWKARQWYIDAVTQEAFRAGYEAGRRYERKRK